MNSVLPEVEGWVKVAGAAAAVLLSLLVPIRSWIAEDRKYKAQTLEAVAGAAKAAVAGASAARSGEGSMLGDTVAMGGLIDAVRDVATAIREGTTSEDAREKDRLTQAIEAFMDANPSARPKPPGRR